MEIIKLYGSMEIAPVVGLSDAIVDLVSTGKTLKENGLEEIEVVEDYISSYLVANTKYFYHYNNEIASIITKLKSLVKEGEENEYI